MARTGGAQLQARIDLLAETLRVPVRRWLDALVEVGATLPRELVEGEKGDVLVRLVASSEYAAAALAKDWEWFAAEFAAGSLGRKLEDAPPVSAIEAIAREGTGSGDLASALRKARNRGLLHILWRSTAATDTVWDSLASLSALADGLVSAAMTSAAQEMRERYGTPRSAAGGSIPYIALAMGKLGGRELNFSSDIDLVFLYADDGEADGERSLSAHEYFTRLTRRVIALLEEVTADGFVYRVDTRLRPFGDSGPPVVSFAALETYLLQHGRGWERYAYVKARAIAPGVPESVVAELQQNVIDPFVYRGYLDYGIFESLREMKALIEAEVRRRELAGNVKLGPGGIREIEFIVQSLQLVRGGADRHLRSRSLRTALRRLAGGRGLGHQAVLTLTHAYEFLRRFENALQAIRDQQTHDIPADPLDRERLALAMGCPDWQTLSADLARHRSAVSEQFVAVAFRSDEDTVSDHLGDGLATRWAMQADEAEWTGFLAAEGFREAGPIARQVAIFRDTSVERQADASARRRLDRFVRHFLPLLQDREHPAVACERVLRIVSGVLRRSAYVALLNENRPALEQLVDLCDKSAYLAGELERYPALLDELLDPRLQGEPISRAAMEEDLGARIVRLGADDSEAVIEALAGFQRATLFRIAVADVSGRLSIMKVSDRLTELAEIVLQAALDVAWRDLVSKHGEPRYEVDGRMFTAGFGVIAYGKLGGIELSYRSDLDIVFLHDSHGRAQATNGERSLDNGQFFSRLVRRLVHFLTAQTSSGALYEVDTRLRPSGRAGLLVVSVDGFEKYQDDNAWTWEHQALLRSRPVAGSATIGREFERIRRQTLVRRVHRDTLLQDVLEMRAKMRANLDKSTSRHFDLKQGEGGIGDIEFLVQYLVLRNADRYPALIHYPDNIRQLGVLGAVGLLPVGDVARLQAAYRDFRLATHRLALDERPSLVDADRFVAERDFVRRIWQREMC